MYLKKVEILGFKSFANKTTLEFLSTHNNSHSDSSGITSDFGFVKESQGITAIVGPNGSGKSNVSDAIKWAMGEQSMKNLRGKKSEDVIFAGSGSKARLSSAYVTLFFDNTDKRIPLEFEEVSITRKIYRNGETEYLINGNKTRLIDVSDLLARAGVGKESYCVINQGMSDALLNATPVERKSVLEDAAGVKQYQIKKDRSLKRLFSTRENMDKTASLIREIEPHLKMLKRQAEKAQQGKEILLQLKERQIKYFSFLWENFQNEREKISSEKETLGATMINLQREVDKIADELNRESRIVQKGGNEDVLDKKKNELRQKFNDIERELIITEGRIVIEKEKLANQKIIEIIPVDLKYVQEKVKNIRIAQERLIARVEEAENLDDLQDIKESARAIQQQLYDLYEDSGKGEVSIKKDNSREVNEINLKITSFEERKKELQEKEIHFKKELDDIERKIIDEIKKEKEKREKFFQIERENRLRQEQLNVLKDQFNDSKIKLARVEVREEDLIAEIKNELKFEVDELLKHNKEFEVDQKNNEVFDKEKIEREIEKLKFQMQQIGGIDPMIIQEYQETNARFDFLTKELDDLRGAIVSLEEIIKEMDHKISEEFEKAFEQINKEFAKYFKIIFGGGNANLSKIKIPNIKKRMENLQEEIENEDGDEQKNQEEESETGVEIVACPPGKKIANLSMLSGGERSLTSIALLFAIISHNPPPFAILDEVEAALDEANSKRFSRILQEFSSSTQFIAITHNRETMRQASLLYGVTMGEDGISKLLSVKLDQIGQGGKIS